MGSVLKSLTICIQENTACCFGRIQRGGNIDRRISNHSSWEIHALSIWKHTTNATPDVYNIDKGKHWIWARWNMIQVIILRLLNDHQHFRLHLKSTGLVSPIIDFSGKNDLRCWILLLHLPPTKPWNWKPLYLLALYMLLYASYSCSSGGYLHAVCILPGICYTIYPLVTITQFVCHCI